MIGVRFSIRITWRPYIGQKICC